MAKWNQRRALFTDYVFRLWYRIVNRLDRNGEVVFMNYGFCNGIPTTGINQNQEVNRTSIQLYDQLVNGIDLKDKHLLEVGSGRGGGLAFLSKKYQPNSATGIDIDKSAINFCNKNHRHLGLRFMRGNAQKLPLDDNSMDVIINVESSHRYLDMKVFLSEVKRVLRPGGAFLITDFRQENNLEHFYDAINNSGLIKVLEVLITPFVVAALAQDDERRRGLVERLVPWGLRKPALEFAGVIGSNTYRSFETGRWTYFNYHFKKESL